MVSRSRHLLDPQGTCNLVRALSTNVNGRARIDELQAEISCATWKS